MSNIEISFKISVPEEKVIDFVQAVSNEAVKLNGDWSKTKNTTGLAQESNVTVPTTTVTTTADKKSVKKAGGKKGRKSKIDKVPETQPDIDDDMFPEQLIPAPAEKVGDGSGLNDDEDIDSDDSNTDGASIVDSALDDLFGRLDEETEEKTFTEVDVRTALQKVVKKFGNNTTKELIKKTCGKLMKLSEIPREKYSTLIEACNEKCGE